MVLVTGASGFIGAYIIKELVKQGHTVRAIRRSDSLPFFVPESVIEEVEWVRGDLFDIVSLWEAMQGAEAVIHAAAKVSYHPSDRAMLYKTNIEGTANVVNMAIESGIARMVYVSSVSAIGRKQDGGLITENSKWENTRNTTHYSVSKYHAEMEVWRGIGEGLNAVIVNPATVLGYGDWNLSSTAIFKNVYNEFPWYTRGINGFVDVDDVARAIVALLDSPISNERFILNGENWPFQRLFDTIADGFGKKRPSRHASPFLGQIAWRIEKIKSLLKNTRPLLTKESAKLAQSKTFFDNSKILRALPGFSFTPIEESIAGACKKYLALVSSRKEK